MRFYQLTEATGGTFVGVKLTDDSVAQLLDWMDQNSIKKPLTADEIHVTLVISKDEPIDFSPLVYSPVIPVDPTSYAIDQFGDEKNVTVLKFDCPFLEKRHEAMQAKYGLTWDHPTYAPHISLSYTVQDDGIIDALKPPKFAIELAEEYVEPFDED